MKGTFHILDSDLVNSSFNQSLYEHQLFVEVLLANTESDGLIYLSQTHMAILIGKSQTLVSSYIKQLNRIDQCISQVSRGVFPMIRKSLTRIMDDSSKYLYLNNKEKADYLSVDIKLIPVIDAYLIKGTI